MSGLKRLIHEIHRRSLWQVLAIYLGTAWVAYEAVEALTSGLGLPDWVPGFAIVLLVIGLPIVLGTAFVQEGGPAVSRSDPTLLPNSERIEKPAVAGRAEGRETTVVRRLLTWRKAILGGVLAFAFLGVVVTGYMAMRTLGIGPVGSLVAAGVLDPQDRIILADFDNHTADSLLSVVATEAFRVDLAQSPLVTIAERGYVSRVLERMERPGDAALDLDLAREVAVREGLKAVIAGEIGTAGTAYVLSTRLVTADAGEVLAAYRETASDSTEIIDAIDRLSKKLRERIGESLKSIRAEAPLERVTTPSLEALRKYSQAVRAVDLEGDDEKAIALLDEAVALDTAFAMAYRKLGAIFASPPQERARAVEALRKAYEHRDRLTDRERYLTLGTYHSYVTSDREKAITAYRTLLDTYPEDSWALNNLGVVYYSLGDYERAAELYRRAVEADSSGSISYTNLAYTLTSLGEYEQAGAILDRAAERFPENPSVELFEGFLASARGDYDESETRLRALREAQRGNLGWEANTSFWLAALAKLRGKLAEAERHFRDVMAANRERGEPDNYLEAAINLGFTYTELLGDGERALQVVQTALDREPLDSIRPLDRPYLWLATFYALAGRLDPARATLAAYEEKVDPELRAPGHVPQRHLALGAIALAEGHAREALSEFREVAEEPAWGLCGPCAYPYLGWAHEEAGQPDSAIGSYERFLAEPHGVRVYWDARYRVRVHERLGALYEARGELEKARYHHGRVVELWQDADPALQPRVEAARRAFGALSGDR